MAITVSPKGVIFSTSNASLYTVTITAPTTNRVQLAFVLNSHASAPAIPSSVISTGLTWTRIATLLFAPISGGLRRLSAYVASGTSSDTTVDINFSANQTGCAATFLELDGVDTSGIGGVNCFAEPPTLYSQDGATTFAGLDMGGIAFTGDAVIVGVGLDQNPTSGFTPSESFIEPVGTEGGYATPTARLMVMYKLTYDGTPTATWSPATASGLGAIALELKDIANRFKANPKPGETVTVGDALTDINLTIGSEPPLIIPLRSDTVTVSEAAPSVQIWMTTWNGTVNLIQMPQQADSLTISDVPLLVSLIGYPQPTAADLVTLTDTLTVKGLTLVIPGADLLTLAENLLGPLLAGTSILPILTNDSTTLTDIPTLNLISEPQIVEGLTLSETLKVNLVAEPHAEESTTVTDTLTTIQLILGPQAAETVTLTDGVTITGLLVLIPPVADVVTLSDIAQGIPTGTIPFDNFDDNAQNSAFWDVAATRAATDALVLVSETAHQLRITPRTNAGAVDAYNGYRAVYASNYTDGAVFAEIPQVANSATTARTSLVLAIDTANGYDITQEAGQLYFEYEIGNITTVGLQIAYVPATHRWWRIRHVSAGDTIRYDTSPTGTVWTQQLSIPRPASLPITSLQSGVQAGTYASVASPGVAIVDNINATTLTIFPAESLTLTDTPTVKGLIPKAIGADLVTLTESRLVGFSGTLLIQRAESITLTDFSEAELVAPLADLVTVTDSALVSGLLLTVSRADLVTVSEPPAVVTLISSGASLTISVPDLITLSDTRTVAGLTLPLTAAESVALSETLTTQVIHEPQTAESVTLTDTPFLNLVHEPKPAADLVTMTDVVTVSGLTLPITVADASALTDTPTVAGLTLPIPVADLITLTEARTIILTVAVVWQPNVSDSITLTDQVTITGLILPIVSADSLTLTDDRNVILAVAGVWQSSVSDGISLTDTTTVTGLTLKPPAAESVTLTELATTNLLNQPKSSDSLTTTDVVTTGLGIQPHPSESLTITDVVVITGLTLKPISADTLTLTDTGAPSFSTNIARTETVTVTDTAFVPGLLLKAIAADGVTLSEQRIVFNGLHLGDLVTVSESRNIFVIGGVLTEPLIVFTVPARDFTVEAVVGFTQFIVPARDFTVEAAANPLVFTVPARDFTVEAVVGFTQFIVPARDFTVEAAA